MIVYDPHAHATRDYDDCEVLSRTSSTVEYVPVRSLKEGRWFALHMPAGVSHKFENLGASVKLILENRVSVFLLLEKLMPALSWVEDDLIVPNTSNEAHRIALAEAERNYGQTALDSAFIFARNEGYGSNQIVNALTCLDVKPSDEAILESVDVTRISELVEDA